MACAPCEAARRAAMARAKEGNLMQAAKVVAAGAAAVVGAISKEDLTKVVNNSTSVTVNKGVITVTE